MPVSDLPLQEHVNSWRDGQKAICYWYISADDFMNQVNYWLDPLAMLNHIWVEKTNTRMQNHTWAVINSGTMHINLIIQPYEHSPCQNPFILSISTFPLSTIDLILAFCSELDSIIIIIKKSGFWASISCSFESIQSCSILLLTPNWDQLIIVSSLLYSQPILPAVDTTWSSISISQVNSVQLLYEYSHRTT